MIYRLGIGADIDYQFVNLAIDLEEMTYLSFFKEMII